MKKLGMVAGMVLLTACSAEYLQALKDLGPVTVTISETGSSEPAVLPPAPSTPAPTTAPTPVARAAATPDSSLPTSLSFDVQVREYTNVSERTQIHLVLRPLLKNRDGIMLAWPNYDIDYRVYTSSGRELGHNVAIISSATPRIDFLSPALTSSDIGPVYLDASVNLERPSLSAPIYLAVQRNVVSDIFASMFPITNTPVLWDPAETPDPNPVPTPTQTQSDPLPTSAPMPEPSAGPPKSVDFKVVSDTYEPVLGASYTLTLTLQPVFKSATGQEVPWLNYWVYAGFYEEGSYFNLFQADTADGKPTLVVTRLVRNEDNGKRITVRDVLAWLKDESKKLVYDLSTTNHPFSYTIHIPGGGSTPVPTPTVIYSAPPSSGGGYCTVHCGAGKPCGDSCISASDTCHKAPGRACY